MNRSAWDRSTWESTYICGIPYKQNPYAGGSVRDREQSEHNVEIKAQLPSIVATPVADPKCGSLQNVNTGDGHISQRERQDNVVIRLDAFCEYWYLRYRSGSR